MLDQNQYNYSFDQTIYTLKIVNNFFTIILSQKPSGELEFFVKIWKNWQIEFTGSSKNDVTQFLTPPPLSSHFLMGSPFNAKASTLSSRNP